jgi:hypothetical protein
VRFLELIAGLAGRLLDTAPKRTLCCSVPMHDAWVHSDRCPQYPTAIKHAVDARRNARVPMYPYKRGDTSGMCPECGYPTGHYGIYTVGEPCPYCGYVEEHPA